MSSYRVAPIFLIRLAGVPFGALRRLATEETAKAAREVLLRQKDLSASSDEAEKYLASRSNQLPAELFRNVRAAVRSRKPIAMDGEIPRELQSYVRAAFLSEQAGQKFDECLAVELAAARRLLLESAANVLPRYLVFGAPSANALLAEALGPEGSALSPRNKRARERERHVLLYLQRIAAKNDTFSEFGPASWGRVAAAGDGISFRPDSPITQREGFLERWTAQTIADAINKDVGVRPELSPRIHPHGRLDQDYYVDGDTGIQVRLDERSRAILEQADGKTPAYRFSESIDDIAELAERSLLKWGVEIPALDPYSVDTLLKDIGAWRDNAVRSRWLETVGAIAKLPHLFARTADPAERKSIMSTARGVLTELGAAEKASQRSLYAALNPIAEECFRDSEFSVAEKVIDQIATDGALWIDFWRDSYALIAARVAAGLRELLAQVAPNSDSVTLPKYLNHCANARMSLTGPGLVVLAATAFREVKQAFIRQISTHAHLPEYALTAEDCHIVRNTFDFPRFDEYTYPSADLQLSAVSPEAVATGSYEWILGELHPPVAILHHGAYWSCPDHGALSDALSSTVFGRPSAHFGIFAADFTAHTSVHYFDALPRLTNFVASQRAHPSWRQVPPSEVEVFVEEGTGDVAMRHRDSHEYLGSFARAWIIPLGFHPFHFGISPHTPRLRCGKVIVQRRAWTVRLDEFPAGNFTGVSRDLVLAIERLRAEKDWPRHIYIRPTEQALRRSGAEGRDKDTKPVYIDLESYLFLEIFYRWLSKSGELEVTEMLPDPDHLCWEESDGHRTFELRTLIVPRT